MNFRRRSAGIAIGLLMTIIAATALAPEVLAFPYRQVIGDTILYSESPWPATMPNLLARSDALLRQSAIYGPGYGRRIFLTDGGWRWRVLALQWPGAFAFTRPLSEAVVINRSDPAHDLVFNGATVAGRRTLSGVIAHERTHGLIRARYGPLADMTYPAAIREGYCDIVAGGGSLTDAEAATLEVAGKSHPALLYYHGRRRVEAMLKRNGGNVDAVFMNAVR